MTESPLDELRRPDGREAAEDVLFAFREETNRKLAELESGLVSTSEAAHFIKGSALSLGLRQLAAVCDEVASSRPQETHRRLTEVYLKELEAFASDRAPS